MMVANQIWVVVGAVLVFFMQTGFLALETGLVQSKNATMTALKNLVDWCVVCIVFLVCGFGMVFGSSAGGLVGTDLFLGAGIEPPAGNGLGWGFFLFQLGFAGTAVTIVSGAMAERIGFATYIVVSALNALLIYPVVGHWVWGNAFIPGQTTLLSGMGFHDFAGSTVVHSVGGWISLVGVWMLGPRLGRFDAAGRPRALPAHSIPLATLGTFFLWIGWWGFNGASTLIAGDRSFEVIVNTNVAGAAGAIIAYLHASSFQGKSDLEAKFLGGALTGLVAITACAYVVSPVKAILVGAIAGLVHNGVYALLLRLKLDDPVGAVPVHLGGGVLGTLAVGFLGRLDILAQVTGQEHSRLGQIGVQLAGVAIVGVWTATISYVLLRLLRATVGLRASPQEEMEGLNLAGEPLIEATVAPSEALDRSEIERLLR